MLEDRAIVRFQDLEIDACDRRSHSLTHARAPPLPCRSSRSMVLRGRRRTGKSPIRRRGNSLCKRVEKFWAAEPILHARRLPSGTTVAVALRTRFPDLRDLGWRETCLWYARCTTRCVNDRAKKGSTSMKGTAILFAAGLTLLLSGPALAADPSYGNK